MKSSLLNQMEKFSPHPKEKDKNSFERERREQV